MIEGVEVSKCDVFHHLGFIIQIDCESREDVDDAGQASMRVVMSFTRTRDVDIVQKDEHKIT